ncbi:hypothetical protein [Microbispora bryophytorum]|uniref:hypothetical protein n=1 Tax=Microbispora bryophytorum TaxID=1460882 RepID=UPI0033EEF407
MTTTTPTPDDLVQPPATRAAHPSHIDTGEDNMTPPTSAPPTEEELTDYLGALKADDRQHPCDTFPAPRRPSYRGGPELDPMIEDEYRYGFYGQADYDGGA